MKIEGEIMSTINKTTDYSQFQFYATNRKTIIDDLVASIKKENMLESFPILVNKDLYVIDGKSYYINVADSFKPMIRQTQKGKELIIALHGNSASFNYSITW